MLKMSKGKQHTANIENFKVILSKIKCTFLSYECIIFFIFSVIRSFESSDTVFNSSLSLVKHSEFFAYFNMKFVLKNK